MAVGAIAKLKVYQQRHRCRRNRHTTDIGRYMDIDMDIDVEDTDILLI